MSRAHNFSAGPAALPLPVLHELAESLVDFRGCGAGIMEISHRGKVFQAVIDAAMARMRALFGVPSDYTVLLLQGGATQQFYQVPLNLIGAGGKAAYVNTGTWSSKAYKEARKVGEARLAFDGKTVDYRRVPEDEEIQVDSDTTYLHYTTNNTIYGTQFHRLPRSPVPLVADMSSDIGCRPFDVGAHDIIYAGAQKNLGPSGVTAVILSPWALETARRTGAALPNGLPACLDYALYADDGSMYNTPNTFGIHVLERVLAWMESQGGLPGMEARNRTKAELLYAELDRSGFCRPRALPGSRSWMNITWRLPSEELEALFVKEAEAAGLQGLKGHRSAGGLRASLYNAVEPASVEALVAFMRDFEARRG